MRLAIEPDVPGVPRCRGVLWEIGSALRFATIGTDVPSLHGGSKIVRCYVTAKISNEFAPARLIDRTFWKCEGEVAADRSVVLFRNPSSQQRQDDFVRSPAL
jgi:hypothetical protein